MLWQLQPGYVTGRGALDAAGGGGNPLWAITLFQSGFEGTNGQTSAFADDTAQWTLTRANSGELSSTQKEYGVTSAHVPAGTGGWFTGTSANWCLSPTANSDQYFFEFSIYIVALNTYDSIVIDTAGGQISLWCRINSDGNLRWLGTKTGSGFPIDITTTGSTMTSGTWHKWAIEKNSSGVIRIYQNGVMRAKSTPSDSTMYSNSGLRLQVGQGGSSTAQNLFIDNLRIMKGVGAARVNSDSGYTPAVAAFPIGP